MLEKAFLIELRRKGQKLRPVVRLGSQGLTEAVLREIDVSLKHHELMKIRVPAEDREQRDTIIAEICQRLGAENVQRVGHVALLYRPRPAEDKPSKPAPLRTKRTQQQAMRALKKRTRHAGVER